MIVSEIQLYEILSSKIGKEQAKVLVEFVETRTEKKPNEKTDIFATKADIAKLETKISESKVDIIKWLGATAIAMVGIMITVFIAFLKFH